MLFFQESLKALRLLQVNTKHVTQFATDSQKDFDLSNKASPVEAALFNIDRRTADNLPDLY